jgi:very-short-patch-repair endonuclease
MNFVTGKLGAKFRRQHAIDAFIVDFVAISEKLVVEVDGGIHREVEQRRMMPGGPRCWKNLDSK